VSFVPFALYRCAYGGYENDIKRWLVCLIYNVQCTMYKLDFERYVGILSIIRCKLSVINCLFYRNLENWRKDAIFVLINPLPLLNETAQYRLEYRK
jgi:hypothetical protein